MKKISGNKLLVKALKEEGVDTIFGYPGACTIDISDELYKQDYTKVIPVSYTHLDVYKRQVWNWRVRWNFLIRVSINSSG